MTYKQYKFLKGLHKLCPKMDEEQKYTLHFVSDVEKSAKMSKEDVLTTCKELEQLGFVNLCQNSNDAKERSGYIHLVRITYSGVVAKNEYIPNKIFNIIKNIIVPAAVSVICSLIVTA